MNKGGLTILCLLRRPIKKAHARKGKSLVAFNAKNIFQILQKIQSLFFTVKTSFLRLRFYNYTSPLQSKYGMVVHQAAQLHYE